MIKVEKLSYSFPQKDLYKDISFEIENGQHCALIGSNGTGKTTLMDLLMHADEYLYDGKIQMDTEGRIGYVSQFVQHEKNREISVFDYLCEDFIVMQERTEAICKEMETAEEFEEIFERYQKSLDEFQAVDGDNYEVNIQKQLKISGLQKFAELSIMNLSGGEYKLLQIIRQMLRLPNLLIMDEPDVFLDFDNLAGLRELINQYKGTMVVITHNRYLLNHCFNKILHLENMDLQEFDGNYIEYNYTLLQSKIKMQEKAAIDAEEIERQEKVVQRLRADATKVASASRGRALHARASYLERLKAKQVKEPFLQIEIPKIQFPDVASEESSDMTQEQADDASKIILKLEEYQVAFEDTLLEHVSFEIAAGEKVAIVGANGTGKTTMLRAIAENWKDKKEDSIWISPEITIAFLTQLYDDLPEQASGGEKNLMLLEKLGESKAQMLLLDEPTSHLDIYAQQALEQAVKEYKGTVLMVSHDFYSIANCVDYVLYVENHTVRKMSNRAFRKMVYKNHFDVSYLENEQKKKDLEKKIKSLLKAKNYEEAKIVCEQLEEIVRAMG